MVRLTMYRRPYGHAARTMANTACCCRVAACGYSAPGNGLAHRGVASLFSTHSQKSPRRRTSCARHIDDAIGQLVVLAKGVAAIVLDIDDALGIAVGPGEILANEGKIDLHSRVRPMKGRCAAAERVSAAAGSRPTPRRRSRRCAAAQCGRRRPAARRRRDVAAR